MFIFIHKRSQLCLQLNIGRSGNFSLVAKSFWICIRRAIWMDSMQQTKEKKRKEKRVNFKYLKKNFLLKND